jgi:hypothetical protein
MQERGMSRVRTAPRPRNGLPEGRFYVYRGTGYDTLTAHLNATQLTAQALASGAPAATAEMTDLRKRLSDPDHLLLRMCTPCWDDDCHGCQQGTCKCACRDEPVPDPRCGTCGYLLRGANHKISCGGTS